MTGKCENCKTYTELEVHHCLPGKDRKECDKHLELKFMMCGKCHRGTNGCHGKNGAALMLKYKRIGQTRFVAKYGMALWMKLFGRNYL